MPRADTGAGQGFHGINKNISLKDGTVLMILEAFSTFLAQCSFKNHIKKVPESTKRWSSAQ